MAEEFGSRERGTSALGMSDSGIGNSTSALGEQATAARSDGQNLRERAGEVRRDVLDRAVEKKDELKQRASGAIDEQRSNAAQRVTAISRALTGAADSLDESGEPQLSGWIRQAAGQVERVVDYLEGKPVDGMVNDLEEMARHNPALFMGGTYVAGLALGRFLRASAPAPRAAMGDLGEPGLTDEDMREAWHGTDASREATPGMPADASPRNALETGELTSYTNGHDERTDLGRNGGV